MGSISGNALFGNVWLSTILALLRNLGILNNTDDTQFLVYPRSATCFVQNVIRSGVV